LTNEVVAIKKIKLNNEKEGFPITSIREFNILLSLQHPNIVKVKRVVVGSQLDKVYMVMEYMEHELKNLIEKSNYQFSLAEVKSLVKQLLQSIEHFHSKNIMHRDLKTANLLYNNRGQLKVCDFGLARKCLSQNK
jgi:cell division cycle 2-like protein